MEFKLLHGSIRKKLISIVLLATVPIFCLLIGNEWFHREARITAAENDTKAYLNSIAEVQRRITNSTQILLQTVAALPVIRDGDIEESTQVLSTILTENSIYSNILLIDRNGDLVAIGKGERRPMNFKDRKQFQDAMRTGRFAFGEFVIGKATQNSIFPFAMPVLDSSGKPQGALMVGVNLDHYGTLFQQFRFQNRAFLGLCDHKGTRIFRQPNTEKSAVGLPITGPAFQTASTAGTAGTMRVIGSDGVDRMLAFEPLRLSPESPPYMYFFIGLDYASVVAKANQNMIKGTTASILSLSIALSLGWILAWKSIASSIDNLAQTALHFGEGKEYAPSTADYSDGEIGQLAQSFDTMAVLLQERETELKKAKNLAEEANHALMSSIAQTRAIVETMPDLVWVKDPDGVIIFCNRRFEKLYGAAEPEIIGKTDYDFVDKSIADSFREHDLKAIQSDGPVRNEETVVYCDDGHTEDLETIKTAVYDEQGRIMGVLGIARDITQRKQAEETLRESELRFKALHNASFGGIAIHDKGIILECNQGLADISGYDYEELIGMNGLLLIAEHSREEVMSNILSGHEAPYEVFGRRKNGQEYPIRLEAKGIPYRGQQVRVVEFRDITEQKAIEEARQQLISELEEKNTELERFTYTVSHDLKSPLITIRGFAGMLERDLETGDTDHVQQQLGRINDAAEKMLMLLDDLLKLSRIGRMDNPHTEVDLNELVQETLLNLTGQITEKNATISVMDGLPVVLADKIRILEVFQNLIENALKFSSNNDHPRVEIGMRMDDRRQVLYVADNGIGIEQEYQERVFNLFEKLAPSAEGTGVGLALVKRIIENHHGSIWVESEGKNNGTRFCFTLGSTS